MSNRPSDAVEVLDITSVGESSDSALVSSSKDIMAGSARGVTQVLVGHPLDTAKVRLQTSSNFNGTVDVVLSTVKKEGVFGLYRGALSPVLMTAVYSSSLFFGLGLGKRMFGIEGHGANRFSAAEYRRRLIASAAFTGGFCSFVEGPQDLVKAKCQAVGQREFSGSIDCARKIFQQRGVAAFSQGLAATLARNVPGSVAYFLAYEEFSALLGRGRNDAPEMGKVLLAGGLAGMVFWVSIYPVDVVRSRMMVDATDPTRRRYSGLIQAFTRIYRSEGFGAFWGGFSACMLRSFPSNACSFLAFEFVRNRVLK